MEICTHFSLVSYISSLALPYSQAILSANKAEKANDLCRKASKRVKDENVCYVIQAVTPVSNDSTAPNAKDKESNSIMIRIEIM